jgi:hypothetical protein
MPSRPHSLLVDERRGHQEIDGAANVLDADRGILRIPRFAAALALPGGIKR